MTGVAESISMPQSSKLPDLTVEEYLRQEESGNVRHEYVNGQIVRF
jgi:Uma2 family endonuclease